MHTTLDGVKFSEDGTVWSFDAANRTATYGKQKLEGVYLDEDGKIKYRLNEIKSEDIYVGLSGIGADFAIQTDKLDGYGGLKAGTETIVLRGEHFAGGSGITVTSNNVGYAFALIDNVSGVHFTGFDSGEYIYVDENDVTITGGGGSDTISLGLNVTKITVTDMDKGDIIDFYGTIIKDDIQIVEDDAGNKSMVVPWDIGYGYGYRNVTIGGISDIATDLSGRYDTDNGKAYYVGNANGIGVDENRMYLTYVEANDLTPVIELGGLSIVSDDSPRYYDAYGYPQVQINPENFAGNTLTILQQQAGTVVEMFYGDFTGKTLVGSDANNILHDEYAGDREIGDIIQNSGASLVIMCGGGDDSIDNYADNATIVAGSGDNNINLQSGGNTSINGGTGDNQIYIDSNREAVTVDAAQGNNTISGGLISLTVENFNSGDVIDSDYDITSLSIEGGKLVATDSDGDTIATIAGISQLASGKVTNAWEEGANGWIYSQSVGTAGAYIKDGNIAYAENKTFFTLGGLKDGLTAEQIEAGVTISGGRIEIDSTLLQRKVTAGWNLIDNDRNIYAYFGEAGNGSGWTQDDDGKWKYAEGIKPLFMLEGVWYPENDGTEYIIVDEKNKTATLAHQNAFDAANIELLGNAGGYTFKFADDFDATGKSFDGLPIIGDMTFGSDAAGKAYYIISTVADLQTLATYVNAGNNCADYTFKLASDLDLSGVNWTPIGNGDKYFSGTFDGQGHIIKNHTITGNEYNAALFGGFSYGTVKNVNLINANISGDWYVGGIVSLNIGGTIENCFVDGNISGNENVGAIVGQNNGSVTDCYYHSNAGGAGTPVYELSLADGVTANYVSGESKTVDGTTYYLSGATFDLTLDTDTLDPSDAFEKIAVKNGTQIGDNTYRYTVYDNESAQVNEFTCYPKIAGLTFVPNNNGGSYNLDNAASFASLADFLNTYTGDKSILKFNLTADTYEISDAAQLELLATIVNGGNDCKGKTFKLTDDINLNGIENWTPIGNGSNWFRGTFDGDNHTISNLKIDDEWGTCVGLFGYVIGGTIQNVKMVNANIKGGWNVGGIVGANEDTIQNCFVDGTISGRSVVGGIAGSNSGKIDNCTASGEISGTSTVGGIVGANEDTIKNCLTFAKTSGDSNVCAIAVNGYDGSFTNCYRAGDATPADDTPLAYELTLPEGVTVAEDKGVTYNGKLYVPAGDLKLNISATAHNDGLAKITGIINATDNDDGTFTYTMPAENSTPEFTGLPVIAGLTLDASDDSYIIDSVDALEALATYVNNGNICAGLTFKQTEDIILSGESNRTPIGTEANPFAGTFDGGIYDSDGELTDSYTISNLTIKDGGSNVGVIVGTISNGTIENCFVDGYISSGNAIVGNGNGTLTDCYYRLETVRTRRLRGGGALYTLTEPEHFTFANPTGFKTFGNKVFATGTVTFELTADDDRRIIDSLTIWTARRLNATAMSTP